MVTFSSSQCHYCWTKNLSLTLYTDVIRPKPAQEKIKNDLFLLNTEYHAKKTKFSSGVSTVTAKELDDTRRSIIKAEAKLRNLKKNSESHKQKRIKTKDIMSELIETNEEAAKLLKPINGRPRLEETQPDLIAAILKIVETQSSADNRRRTEILRTGIPISNINYK